VTWVTENHDVERTPTRYAPGRSAHAAVERSAAAGRDVGSSAAGRDVGGCAAGRESPDATGRVMHFDRAPRGAARARAALLAVLGLPGAAYVYQGQELGLPEVDVPEDARQDPAWARSGRSRDGCRVPLPWRRDPAGTYGFSPSDGAPPWLPVPSGWGALSVEAAEADPASTLHLCRAALTLRRRLHVDGVLTADDPVTWELTGHRLVACRPGFALVMAMGNEPVPLPPGEVLLTSAPLDAGRLPPDAAAWLRTTTPD
jgi:alpha-glucosidase